MRRVEQDDIAPRLKMLVKDYLYKTSPLRNSFQVQTVDSDEVYDYLDQNDAYRYQSSIKNLNHAEYARIFIEKGVIIEENKGCVVPILDIGCTHLNLKDIHEYYSVICNDIVSQEKEIFDSLKEYDPGLPTGKGILLIKTDIQVMGISHNFCSGFYAYEQIGAVIVSTKTI